MIQDNLTRDICEQHAEEASFLWLLRDQAVHNSNYTAVELAELDERVEAHLDGLRVAEALAWDVCQANYSWTDPEELFAGSVVAFSLDDKNAIEELLQAAKDDKQLARGIISSFGWVNNDKVLVQISRMINADEPMYRRIGVGASGILRKDLGGVLNTLVKDHSDLVCARAIKTAGELGRSDLLPDCKAYLQSENSECRYWAAWSCTLLGDPASAVPHLKEIAEQGGEYAERACDLAARCMELPEAQEWLKKLGSNAEHYRLAVVFSGAIGIPVLIPWLIQLMAVPELSRIAGEMVATITGLDLIENQMAADAPEGFESGPTDDPEDEMVEMDADEDLPWPDTVALSQWWQAYQDHFSPNERYFLGRKITEIEFLNQVAQYGKQTHRSAAALELAMKEPSKELINTCAYMRNW